MGHREIRTVKTINKTKVEINNIKSYYDSKD